MRCGILIALLGFGGAALADPEISAAQQWLASTSGHQATWVDHGMLELPGGQLFVGDPTWGDDSHIKDPRPVAGPLHVYTLQSPAPAQTHLLWLEASGTPPTHTAERISFGVDAATVGLGALEAGQALVALGERWLDQGKGDSFEFISPLISAEFHFAKWVEIPPGPEQMFLASTGGDGGLDAVWLRDSGGGLSGILVDLTGRASDRAYLDTLLPPLS